MGYGKKWSFHFGGIQRLACRTISASSEFSGLFGLQQACMAYACCAFNSKVRHFVVLRNAITFDSRSSSDMSNIIPPLHGQHTLPPSLSLSIDLSQTDLKLHPHLMRCRTAPRGTAMIRDTYCNAFSVNASTCRAVWYCARHGTAPHPGVNEP